MKKFSFTAILTLSILLFSSFSFEASAQNLSSILGAVASMESGGSSGQMAGAALNALYKQYRADGKVDMTKLNNIVNATTLARSIQGLKGQKISSTFCKDFSTGLITGSNSIITSKNSNSITKSLISLAGNASIASLLQNATANTGNANANLSNMIASGSETMAAVNTKIENATKIANSITTVLKLMK